MLYVLKPGADLVAGICLEDILEHRLDFARSEGLETSVDSRDIFDTKDTTYLAYHNRAYGLIGAARLMPKEALPLPLQVVFPKDQKIPFIFADCLFHIPENSSFFQASDETVRKHFEFLLEGFYGTLVTYLENRVLQEKMPLVYFYLHEEDFDFISRYSNREVIVLKEISSSLDQETLYLGAIDFSDMVHLAKPPVRRHIQ